MTDEDRRFTDGVYDGPGAMRSDPGAGPSDGMSQAETADAMVADNPDVYEKVDVQEGMDETIASGQVTVQDAFGRDITEDAVAEAREAVDDRGGPEIWDDTPADAEVSGRAR